MSDYISRLINRSFTAQPAIRRRFPAMFEPLSAENIPSFELRPDQRPGAAHQGEPGPKASEKSRNYIQSFLQQRDDAAPRYPASMALPVDDPIPSVVILDKEGHLFTEKPFPSEQAPRENGMNPSHESAIQTVSLRPAMEGYAARHESEPDQTAGKLRSTGVPSSSQSRPAAISGSLLEASNRLARIRASLSARLITREFQDIEPADFPHSHAGVSDLPSDVHPRELLASTHSTADDMPEAKESSPAAMRRGSAIAERMLNRNRGMEIDEPRFRNNAPAAELVARSSDAAPKIEIRIDRVEVRAVMQQALPRNSQEPPKRKPALSLDEYLEQRKGGNR